MAAAGRAASNAAKVAQAQRARQWVTSHEAQHLAAFKMGGAEFMATMPMLKGFYQAAANVNRRWATMGVFVEMLKAQGRKQEEAEPKEVHESA